MLFKKWVYWGKIFFKMTNKSNNIFNQTNRIVFKYCNKVNICIKLIISKIYIIIKLLDLNEVEEFVLYSFYLFLKFLIWLIYFF